MTLIKMCGITRHQDAEDAVIAGATFLGYVFYQNSARYVHPSKAGELVRYIGNRAQHVGLFVNHTFQEILKIHQACPFDILQFHGHESAQFCDEVSAHLNKPYWKAVHVDNTMTVEDLLQHCQTYPQAQALLFDTASAGWGGAGHAFEWTKLADLLSQNTIARCILSGGLTHLNVAQGIKLINPWCVDVSSGIEQLDGVTGQLLKGIKSKQAMLAFASAVADERV